MAQRFHDLGVSGWYTLYAFIPIIGVIPELILLFMPGTRGDNFYGPDPLDRDDFVPVQVTPSGRTVEERLRELAHLYELGLIDDSTYKERQSQLLDEL